MTNRLFAFVAPLLVGLTTTGCMLGPTIRGNGEMVSEKRDVADFHAIAIGGSGRAIITQGDTESLEIRADENLLPYIRTEVEGGELQIRFQRGNLRFTQPPIFTVTVRELDRLDLSGSLSAEMGRLETERLNARISGSGSIRLGELRAEDVQVRVSGSGEIRVEEGETGTFEIGVSGSGDTRASNFRVRDAEVSISGSGSASLWVTESLDVQVSGSGSVDYRGSPKVSSSISGSGKVRQQQGG